MSASLAETIELKVLSQPGATGLIQQNREGPFFAEFAEKSGRFHIISLRLQQVGRDEPTILGLDLVGLNPTYEAGRKTVEEFLPTLDARLQEQFSTKLLGVWPFGPQVIFCKPEIAKLADLEGKKVRVYDQNLANFISSVGGTPVPLGFPKVHQSLARGVVDCAVTGPSSTRRSRPRFKRRSTS